MKLYVAGEGPNELGGLAGDPAWRDERPGAIHALIDLAVPEASKGVVDGIVWRRIRKYVASTGEPSSKEEQHVHRLALMAHEAGCDGVAFLRDTDGDTGRVSSIRRATEDVRRRYPDLQIWAGTPNQMLEAWIAACVGARRTEGMSGPEAADTLLRHGIRAKDTDAYVDAIQCCNTLPADATSLQRWCSEARQALSPSRAE